MGRSPEIDSTLDLFRDSGRHSENQMVLGEESGRNRNEDEDHDDEGLEGFALVSLATNGSDVRTAAKDPISIISPNSWQKGKLLGRGSFGSVYKGITDDGFSFAIKEVSLLDQGSEGRHSITQLEQEIALLSQFEHENIVQYYGTEKDESHLYIFIELVTKGSLLSLYQKHALREYAVSSYTRQILHALKYLHNQGVVHRDIKCANILVDTNDVVKLVDFGLAKATKLNDVKSCKGTAFWMAPEVVRSQGGYGVSADIWSLGCTVLEMLTRRFPYDNLEWMQALFRIERGERPQIPDSLSKDAQDFILKCLQVDPSSRSTATQLLHHPFVTLPLLLHHFVKRPLQYVGKQPLQYVGMRPLQYLVMAMERGRGGYCIPVPIPHSCIHPHNYLYTLLNRGEVTVGITQWGASTRRGLTNKFHYYHNKWWI